MARTRRVKCEEGVANYHVMSRTNNKLFLFARGRIKRQIVDSLDRIARFSGVKVHAYAVMDNHFHVVCRVAKPETPVSEEEVLRRIAVLKGDRYADDLSRHWAELRRTGLEGVSTVSACVFPMASASWRLARCGACLAVSPLRRVSSVCAAKVVDTLLGFSCIAGAEMFVCGCQ